MPAIVGSAVLVGLFILLLGTGRSTRVGDRDRLLSTGLILIGLAAFIAPLWTLGAYGFIIG